MDGAATASSDAPVAPPTTPIPEDQTGFLPSFWQGLSLVTLQWVLVVLFMVLVRILAMVLPASVLGVAVRVLLSPLPALLSYLVVLRLARRWTRLGWREAYPFPLPSLAQVGAFLVLFAGLELASQGLDPIVDGWLPPMPSFLERAFASLLLACAGALLFTRATSEPRAARSDPALGRPPPPRYPPAA